jgi:TPP-dependent indolepyruvate ferredoxin oxidoreductase alpha subunit
MDNVETIIKRQATILIKDELQTYIEQIIKEIINIVKIDIIINQIVNPEYEINISQINEMIILQHELQSDEMIIN